MKTRSVILLLSLTLAGAAYGQQRVFDWLPASDESVRLDPAYYYTGRSYHPGPNGGNIHVDIEAQKPVTIFLTGVAEWNEALRDPETIVQLRQVCLREHIVRSTYLCELPAEPMVLIIRDERNSFDRAVFAGLGAVLKPERSVDQAVGVGIETVLTGQGSVARRFISPNDVHVQYYRWNCVENCIQPELQWIRQVKEKYELTSFLKVYGGYRPGRDGEKVSVKIKSPAPMVVAILPSNVADQLHGKPEMFEAALEKNSCQQRGVQSLQFECTFNADDGPQSLVVAPESSSRIPAHKKAEIEMLAVKCVANCSIPKDK